LNVFFILLASHGVVYLMLFAQSSLCVSAEIWVHGDGAILAPPIVLPFIDIPFELDSTHDSSMERKWSEFPLNLQLRIADLPADRAADESYRPAYEPAELPTNGTAFSSTN
jgi:hypothetical protein